MKTNYRKSHLVFKESYRKPRTKALKESKLNEQVQDEAYEIAEEMFKYFDSQDKHSYTRDEVEEQFASAVKKLYGVDVLKVTNEDGNAVINGKTFDVNELLEGDIRGILGYNGWATIFEGDNEGGITDGEEVEESLKEEDEKVQDEPTKSLSDKVKEAIKVLESIDPKVFYTALGIYEWTEERDPDDEVCQRVYEFLDGVDTVYDDYVRGEVQDIVNAKDFPTEDDDEMEFFNDFEDEEE